LIKEKKATKSLIYFLIGWTLLNLFQGYTTELFHDEGLYWAFAQRPSWGYFDHPPLTAWLIALSSSLIPGELGVRLIFVLMSTGAVYYLWKLTQPTDELLFFVLISAMSIMHVGGFFAAPDIPLIFLSAFLLWLYRKYYYKDSILLAVVIGLILGLMGLAKYHAVIFAIAVALSNLKLYKRKSFYLGFFVAAIVIAPHILWQIQNDWVTFEFHLYNRRGEKPFSMLYPLEYLGGQLLFYGPLVSLLLLPAAKKYVSDLHYDCAMKYSFYTIFVFFFLSSFRGKVEANWTAAAFVPAVYLGYRFIETLPLWKKWVMRLAIPSILLLLLFRATLMFDILPENLMPRNETHGYIQWTKKISELAGDRPVVFMNSYKKAAKYTFYTGKKAYSLNKSKYSGNQYDLWDDMEIDMQGKDVMIVSNELFPRDSMFFTHGIHSEKYQAVEDYRSFNMINVDADITGEPAPNAKINTTFTVTNPTSTEINFKQAKHGPVAVRQYFYQYENPQHYNQLLDSLPVSSLKPGESISFEVESTCPPKKGRYKVKYALFYNDFDGMNSFSSRIDVK